MTKAVGSSPQVRGPQLDIMPLSTAIGLIPAGAGTTLPAYSPP